MRIFGLIILGLFLFSGVLRILVTVVGAATGRFANAAPGYAFAFIMGQVVIVALLGALFVKLLKSGR